MVRLYNINRSFHCYAEIFSLFKDYFHKLQLTYTNAICDHAIGKESRETFQNVLTGRTSFTSKKKCLLYRKLHWVTFVKVSCAIPHKAREDASYRCGGVGLPTVPFVLISTLFSIKLQVTSSQNKTKRSDPYRMKYENQSPLHPC